MRTPISVVFAEGELEKLEFKLFIGLINRTIDQDQLYDIFSPFGTVLFRSVSILALTPGHSSLSASSSLLASPQLGRAPLCATRSAVKHWLRSVLSVRTTWA